LEAAVIDEAAIADMGFQHSVVVAEIGCFFLLASNGGSGRLPGRRRIGTVALTTDRDEQ
jgi:hypothetical protein